VSILVFLAITFGAGAAGLLTRRRPPVSISIGLLGLAAALVSALLVSPGDRLVVGESALVATDFMHLFIVFGSVGALALCVMALAADSWQRNLSSAMLLGLGALALGLALADPVAGLAATAAAGLPGVLVAITTPVDARGVRSAARELRAVAVTGAFALVAAALVSGPSGLVNLPTTVVGLAYLAMALAVAVRIGAIPFHTRVARVTGSAPTAALPLLLALAPAGFASAALVWIDGNIATTAIPLDAERAVIVVVGLLCLLLGVLAATIQDDIEHVVGYSVIQDAGFVLLALAVFDAQVWEPARTWLLIYVVTKSAFAGWALAMRASFGTSRIGELSGWIRRAPLLAITLAFIVAATVGIPGLLVFDVRTSLATLSLGSPLALLAIAGGLGSLLYYGRLARTGIGPVAPLVAAYAGVRPRGPGWVAAHAGAGVADTGAADARAAVAGTTGVSGVTAEATIGTGMGGDRRGRRGRRGAEPLPLAFEDLVAAPIGAETADAAADAETSGAAPAAGAVKAPAPTPERAGIEEADVTVTAAVAPVADMTAPAVSGPGAPDAGVDADADAPAFLRAAPTRPAAERQASERPPSTHGPRIDQLRRDPKELTQAWAREALERAGLAPPSAENASSEASRPPDPTSPAAVTPHAPDAGIEGSGTVARGAGGSPAPVGLAHADPTPAPADATTPGAGPAWPGATPTELGPEARGDAGRPVRRPPAPAARRTRAAGGGAGAGSGRATSIGALWAANRLLVVALLALALSGLGLAAAVGAFGVADAARAQAPSPNGDIFVPEGQSGEPNAPDGGGAPGASTSPASSGAPLQPGGSPAATDPAAGPEGTPAGTGSAPAGDQASPAATAAP
jgi:NADH:ubiquinone oxidoreductase subunit 2 (subunit N)